MINKRLFWTGMAIMVISAILHLAIHADTQATYYIGLLLAVLGVLFPSGKTPTR